MSQPPKITDFSSIIEPHLNGAQLVSYNSRYLTKPGENYGSIMISVSAMVKRPNGEIEELPLVAKLPPLTNELFWTIFNPERTCLTENATYKYLAPALRELQLEAGIKEEHLFDCFAKYYGSRISLDASAQTVDRDAVLIQENLVTAGYRAPNRNKMFDFEHTKLVLESMAKYHALPIALRLKKPEYFNKYVRPYFLRFNMQSTSGPEVKLQVYEEALQEVEFATNNNAQTVERCRKLFDLYDAYLESPNAEDGPYTTLAHCDMWINNIMLQYDENGAPLKLKFVDFQIAQYESVIHDIIFFLLSNVENEVLEQNYDEFLRIYYDAFLECLRSVEVSTAEYTYESFLAELKRAAPTEVPHALFMAKVIFADSSTMPEDFKDLDMNLMTKNKFAPAISKKTGEIVRLSEKFKFFD